MSQDLSYYSGDQLTARTQEKDLRVSVLTIHQASELNGSGVNPVVLHEVSTSINTTADDVLAQIRQINQQNTIIRALFGGDRRAASRLAEDASIYTTGIQSLEQELSKPGLNPAMATLLRQQLDVLYQERDRISGIASNESQNKGIFGQFLS